MQVNFGVLVSITLLSLPMISIITEQDSSVIANSSIVEAQKNALPQTAIKIVQAANRQIKIFTNSLFEIQYPSNWFLQDYSPDYKQGATPVVLILLNQPPRIGSGLAPVFLIKTDISIQKKSFAQALSEVGYSRMSGYHQILSQQKINLNSMQAVRTSIFMGGDFSNSIVTTIRYTDRETVTIISFYNPRNLDAEEAIINLHNSFRKPVSRKFQDQF